MTRASLKAHLEQGKPLLLKRKPSTFDGSPEAQKLKREIQAWNSKALTLLKRMSGADAAAAAFADVGKMKYSTLSEVKEQLRARRKVIEQFLGQVSRTSSKAQRLPRQKQPTRVKKPGGSRSSDRYAYDVCLSFAGEDRKYVEQLYLALIAEGVKVFYDFEEDIAAEMWGKDLYTYLDDVYQNRAKYCVMFLSKNYARKVWTNHERESAQAGAFLRHQEYILPLRLDNTLIPGIRPTTGFRKWSEGVPKLTRAILAKLKKSTPSGVQPLKRVREPVKKSTASKRARGTGHTVLLGSQLFQVEHLERIPNQHFDLRLKVKGQQLMALRAMESPHYGAKMIRFVNGLDAFDVQVSVLKETTSRGSTVATLKLVPIQRNQGSGMHRIGWNGKSATDLAAELARQLLLGESPNGDAWSRVPVGLPNELIGGVLPLAKKSANQSADLLQWLKHLAVYYLRSEHIVDEISELTFRRLKTGKVSVTFRGSLSQSWSSEPGEIVVKGTVMDGDR